MRVFTDGACTSNGRPGAKAGYAVWFPDNQSLSASARIPAGEPQTNQRAELAAIHRAVVVLEEGGFRDEDLVIYTDSEYCVNCLTKWITGWVSRGWKTAAGGDVLHRDLIQDTSSRLARFKSYRFVHVRSHTGGEDDLSRNNDIVDRMARATVDDTVREVPVPAEDVLFEGCPLQLMGSPVAQSVLLHWMRENLSTLDRSVVDKHLMKALTELCKTRNVTLTKQTIQKSAMIRAERMSLQITRVDTDTTE
jgi:ribonuclease HI